MLLDPYLVQWMTKDRIEDVQREVEQARLIRAAQGPRRARGWWTSLVLMLGSLVGLVIRPQS